MKRTIEERAIECCMTKFPNHETADAESMRFGYIHGATEQDRISRQEERERCVKAAQEYTCRICHPQCMPQFKGGDFDKEKCGRSARLRKAIEEEGNQ